MINSLDDWFDSRADQRERNQLQTRVIQLNGTLECRFEITQPVEEAQARVDSIALARQDALSRGLVGLVLEDNASVQDQIDRIVELSTEGAAAQADLLRAVDQRAQAVETCGPNEEETPDG